MQRFLNFLTNSRTLSILGVIVLTIFLLLMAQTFEIGLVWAGVALGVLLALWLLAYLWKRWRARQASKKLEGVLEQAASADKTATPDKREEVEALRVRLAEAVKTIKRSKLGQLSGDAALYELPWYIVIGNPAAGKSTAVLNSGLQFPFADKGGAVIQGIGGTRNCDWFFTTEGILLDTAGRYSVHEEDRREWLGFLDLLKRYRPKAPINGIVVTVSVSELTQNRPEFAINLAKNLRQRVQELTERLEVFAPVYVMFTKADLITGFTEFFGDSEKQERDRVWGASLPFEPDAKPDVAALFDQRFDELCDGLKEISVAQIALHQKNKLSPGLLSFPLEFASIKPTLRSFLVTLFDENPFQYKPVFRGFYFTSALQEGATNSVSAERIARRFGLSTDGAARNREVFSKNGFFLRDLFSKVIFADRLTVRQFASPAKTRLRIATFFGLVLALGLMLGGWTWSYMGNRTLTANVQADLDKIVKMQQNRVDLQARLEALDMLQDRIEQLDRYRNDHPLALSLGLYQGDTLQHKLLDEYYNGLRQVMLKPVGGAIETFLAEVNAHPDQLAPMVRPPETGAVIATSTTSVTAATATMGASGAAANTPAGNQAATAATGPKRYTDASPTNVEDGYNALKTYLMLSDKRHVEVAHLTDQVTRFWRGWLEDNRGSMPREQMIRSAERNLSFFLARVNDDNWPLLEGNLSLIDQTRENLRHVVRGMPARERAYAEIKARASTRYAPMTVARIVGETGAGVIAGSYAVPGTFTKDAWFGYVQPAIREAANKELQTKDWVLNVAARDDLTLEGSPEQIQKALVTMYKTEYAREWQRFMQGVAVQDFTGFEQAVTGMNLLGDPTNSPIRKVLDTAYDQTSWDNPSMLNAGLKQAKTGVLGWFKQLFARQTPSQVNVNLEVGGNAEAGTIPMGPVGKEFSGLARVVMVHDDKSLLRGYMDSLSKVRTRFNLIKNQGDPGPGARQLMQQTLDGNGSELADTLKYVDEQMLTGMTDSERATLRPLLVRPLLQSYAVVIRPATVEVNKVWNAQVYQPFATTLADKYPFSANAKIEASAAEIGQVFGPDGSIAKFASTTIGPLSVRRGDMLAARTWGDLGLSFVPEFTTGFTRWIAPLTGGAAGGGAGGAAAAAPQTVFQILPVPSQGATEYTIEIDGQQLRYRNTPPQWTNFVWPNPQGTPGARVTATTFDGRTLELLNEPGRFGLERLIATAQRKRRPDGAFDLSWTKDSITVSISLRIISSPQTGGTTASDSPQGQGLRGLRLPTSIADMNAPLNTSTPPAPAGSPPAGQAPAPASTQAAAQVAHRPAITEEQGGTAQ